MVVSGLYLYLLLAASCSTGSSSTAMATTSTVHVIILIQQNEISDNAKKDTLRGACPIPSPPTTSKRRK